ncbi:hypothetical protein HFO99_25025 [Rhizobium leguminosarum]|uniref:hypothetical protein n=1 Tax=Rhizobium leguminosarum TaxID=384 RepID=UPI001C94F2CB|nr:hypothetical protein [Rhizobium leguminosarum]MBY5337134.1 hypothetical protein [Rhizobium leguminosarum]
MMNAISLALTKPMGGAPAIPPPWVPDASRYMPAATGTRWPAGFTQTYAAGLNYQCSKLFFGSPDYPTNDFLIPFTGFGLTEGGTAPQETVNPNANIEIDEVFFIHPDGTEYPVLFGGLAAATVTAATGIVYGQVTLSAPLPAWSIFGIRTVWHGSVGNSYIGGYRCQRHRGEKYWAATDLASVQALAAANAASTPDRDPDAFYNTAGNVSNSQPLAYGPAMVLAKGWDGRPVPLVLADSLVERQELAASADARRNMGIWRRWLDQRDPVWGSCIPLVMGVPGSKSVQELATSATLRWNMIDAIATTYNGGKPIWTFVLDQSGRNDNNATASTWSNAKFGLVDRVKTRYGAGTHVVGITLMPTFASTDAGRTVAGFAVATLWNPVTGTLATVNNSIKASARYAGVIDMVPAFMSDADPTKGPAAELFPLGNVVGHPGNQDGVTTWDTMTLPAAVPLGSRIIFEYQPGLWTSRTLIGRADNGDGTADYKVSEIFATNVQDNATLLAHGMNLDTSSYVHPVLHGVLRTVSRIPQSEKLKFYP